MPKLEKVKTERGEDGKVTYLYKKIDENGTEKLIKAVYEPTSSDRLPFTLDLIQRMKAEGTTYKNKTEFWKAYKERSKQERDDIVPYEYTHFVKLNRVKTETQNQ